jgi:hypothetical protein
MASSSDQVVRIFVSHCHLTLINGAFLPDKMPTNGLRGALRRFFLLVSAT